MIDPSEVVYREKRRGAKDGALWDTSGELAGARHFASPGDLVGSSGQV